MRQSTKYAHKPLEMEQADFEFEQTLKTAAKAMGGRKAHTAGCWSHRIDINYVCFCPCSSCSHRKKG